MSISSKKYSKQAILSSTGKAIVLILSFLGSIVIVRYIGSVGYGEFYTVLAISALTANIVSGWSIACGKKQAEEDFSSAKAFFTSLSFSISFSLFSALIGISYILLIGYKSRLVALIVLLIIGKSIFKSNYQTFISTDMYGYNNFVLLINNILRLVFQLILLFYGWGVEGLVIGFFLGDMISSIMIFLYLDIGLKKIDKESLQSIIDFSKYSIPNQFLSESLSKADIVLLTILSVSTIVGNYQTALNLSLPAMIASSSLSDTMRTKVSNMNSLGQDYSNIIRFGKSYSSILAIPILFGSLAIGEWIVVTVYTNEFLIASTILPYLALLKVLISQRDIYLSVFNAINKPEKILKIGFVSILANIIFGVLLFYIVGYIGVVIASVIAGFIGLVYSHRELKKHIDSIKIVNKNLAYEIFAGIVMYIIVYILRTQVLQFNLIGTIIAILTGGIFYFGVLYIVSANIRNIINSNVSKIF